MVPLRAKANALVFGRLKRLPILRTIAAPAPLYASTLRALHLDRVSMILALGFRYLGKLYFPALPRA